MLPLFTLLASKPIGTLGCIGGFCPTTPAEGPTQISNLFTVLLGVFTIIGGLAFLIYFLVGALGWITAGGDTGKVDKAKAMMTNGAIGLIIVVASYGVIWIVGEVLGFNILDPASLISKLQ